MTDESRTYNGWANYETWCVNLWLENEQSTSDHWRETGQEIWAESTASSVLSRSEVARFALADRLKSDYEEQMPDLGASVWADMLGAAFAEVAWDDIADSLLVDCEDKGFDADDSDAEPEKYESR